MTLRDAVIQKYRNKEGKSVQVKGKKGARCFLAVAGGINTPAYLGSRSTFPGGKLGGVQVISYTSCLKLLR